MSSQNKPTLRDEIKEAVLGGEEMEGPSEKVDDIIAALKDDKEVLTNLYDLVRNDTGTKVTTDSEVIGRTHGLIADVIEQEHLKMEAQIKELDAKLTQMKKTMENKPETKKQLQEIERKLSNTGIIDDERAKTEQDRDKIFQNISDEIIASPEYQARARLQNLLKVPLSDKVKAEKEKIKKTDVSEKKIQRMEIKELVTPKQIADALEYYNQFTDENGDTPSDPNYNNLYLNSKKNENPTITRRYQEFRKLMEKRGQIMEEINSKLLILTRSANFNKEAEDYIKERFNQNPDKVLLLHILNVKNLKEAADQMIAKIKSQRAAMPKHEITPIVEIDQITTTEQIRNHELKWQDVVNRLGDKPKTGDTDLYRKAKERNTKKQKLSPEDIAKYQAFQKFITRAPEVTKKIDEIIGQKVLNLQGKTAEQIQAVAKDSAEAALNELSQLYKNQDYALMLYCLGVDSEEDAYHKITNILLIRNATEARKKSKNKETYSEIKDETTGAPLTMSLEEYAKEKDTHPEIIIEKTNELLYKLFITMDAHEAMDIEEFRNALIEIIKTKGEKEIPVKLMDGRNSKIKLTEAKSTYTKLLIMKDKDIQDKEILMFLIALKKKPPFVYDHLNDGHGWVLKGNKKTGPGVLENFNLDGAAYLELMHLLNMKKKGFNVFIQKIAPIYEDIRSQLVSKRVSKQEITLAELNTKVPNAKFTDEDLAKFRELMTIPLWMEKIAGAYKYSKYVDESFDIQIPKIQETQGPDVVKKIEVVFVNIEEKLKRIAERIADERLDQEMKELGPQGWTQLWRLDKIGAKWWKRNAMEGYRDKYAAEIITRLKEDPKYRTELMELGHMPGGRAEVKPGYLGKLSGKTPTEGVRQDLNSDLDAIAERFGISWATKDTASYLTTGETIENKANIDIQAAIKTLCVSYVNDTINEAQFRNEIRTNIIPRVQAMNTPPNEEIISFLEQKADATIPLEERQGLLDKLNAHKAGLIELDLKNLEIGLALGKAKNVDVKTQVKDLSTVDRISRGFIEKIQKSKFLGRFINPTTVAIAGFGLANIATQLATSHAVRWGVLGLGAAFAVSPAGWPAVAGIATGCLTGGLMSYIRQNKEQLHLKAQKERRQALTYRPESDRKGLRPGQAEPSRYERLLETGDRLYKKENVTALAANIEAAEAAGDYDALRDSLAKAIALNEMSEVSRIDLIQYENEMSVESQRLNLVKKIAKGKIAMRASAATLARDADNDLVMAIAAARADITTNNINLTEANFKKFKRWENMKSAGIGALIGGGISALSMLILHGTETVAHSRIMPITPGRVNEADFTNALRSLGIPPADISTHVHIDPVTGKLDPASITWLKTVHNLNANDLISAAPHTDLLFSGSQMSKTDLLNELTRRGISTTSIRFDAAGHLDAASVAYLRGQNINITEILIPGSAPGTSAASRAVADLNRDGFNTLAKLHFNDNQPHAPNAHILDELKLWWQGRPAVGPDGNCHFTIKDMFNRTIPHSHLPPGVSMPGSPEDIRIALQMRGTDGNNYWKLFTPDASGEIAIPARYFDPAHLGVVPRGGSTLPGLRTDALAVGFNDPHNTFQILASVRGHGGGPIPSDMVNYLGVRDVPASATYELHREITDYTTERFALATAPIISAPMKHLEYGKKKKPVSQEPQPPVPPVTPQQPEGEPVITPTHPEAPEEAETGAPEAPVEAAIGTPAPTPEIKIPEAFAPNPERIKVEQELDALEKNDKQREELQIKLNALLKTELEESIAALNKEIDELEAALDKKPPAEEMAALLEKREAAYEALFDYEFELEKITGIRKTVPRLLKEYAPVAGAEIAAAEEDINKHLAGLDKELADLQKELESLKYNANPERQAEIERNIKKINEEKEKLSARIENIKTREETMGAAANTFFTALDSGKTPDTYPANIDDAKVAAHYLRTMKNFQSRELALKTMEGMITDSFASGSNRIKIILNKDAISRGRLSAIREVGRELGYKIGAFTLEKLPNGKYQITAPLAGPAEASDRTTNEFTAELRREKIPAEYPKNINDQLIANRYWKTKEKTGTVAAERTNLENILQQAEKSPDNFKFTAKTEDIKHGQPSALRDIARIHGIEINTIKLEKKSGNQYEISISLKKK